MAIYAIGDVQGCFRSLRALLDLIKFSDQDQLWLAGDLVNRGPESLEVLRLVRDLGAQARTVLGNHDLHLLAIYSGAVSRKPGKTLKPVLAAKDCDTLMEWLIQQPLLIDDPQRGYLMTHAGVPHIWSLNTAIQCAQEVQRALLMEPTSFFAGMYGNEPACWHPQLTGNTRLRTITNYFTRMRFVAADGTLDFTANEGLESQPDGFLPWFEQPRELPLGRRLLCGHWAALGFYETDLMVGLDSGCVWGNRLTAFRLEDGALFSIPNQDSS